MHTYEGLLSPVVMKRGVRTSTSIMWTPSPPCPLPKGFPLPLPSLQSHIMIATNHYHKVHILQLSTVPPFPPPPPAKACTINQDLTEEIRKIFGMMNFLVFLINQAMHFSSFLVFYINKSRQENIRFQSLLKIITGNVHKVIPINNKLTKTDL